MEYNRFRKKTDCYKPVYQNNSFHSRGKPAAADNFWGFLTVFLSVLLILTGCATTLPTDVQRTPSTAFGNYNATSTGQLFEEAALEHPAKSGFAIIRKGRPAFTGRIAMTAMAEKSMDLQYYIWEPDTTGRILALRLVEAADRGGTRPHTGGRQHPCGSGLAHRRHRCASQHRDQDLQFVSSCRTKLCACDLLRNLPNMVVFQP
jgi:hypothetical protein